ncbi:hypothetical protein TNCV_1649621 [Trichonephila clavipes]|nr:hypothetical protein TNCV_1649621 [Trichonephila clavipes]
MALYKWLPRRDMSALGVRDINIDEDGKHTYRTATAGSDVVQSGRPIFDDFFQHLWPYIGNNTANVVFMLVIMALYRSPLTVTLWPSSFLKKDSTSP